MKILLISLITMISASCGSNNTYKRKPLPPRVVTVPAENSNDAEATQAAGETSEASENYSSTIQKILADNNKIDEFTAEIVEEIKTLEPNLELSNETKSEMVAILKAANPKSASDIADALIPPVQNLFRTDPKLNNSDRKFIVLNSPDVVKSLIVPVIEKKLKEES